MHVFISAPNYELKSAGISPDLTAPMGPIEPVLSHLDPILATPIHLTESEILQLTDFVRSGLLDPRAKPHICAS